MSTIFATLATRINTLTDSSRTKYIGLTLVLAWHYCLWFVPAFPNTFLLDDRITFCWLVTLVTTSLTVWVLALLLGRTRHLPTGPTLGWVAAVVGSLATLSITYGITILSPAFYYATSVLIGMSSGLLWLLWGEHHARRRSPFTLSRIGPTYGLVVLLTLGITVALPDVAAPIFIALIPLISGFLLHLNGRAYQTKSSPHLLPRKMAHQAFFSICIVCIIAFVTSLASYFTVAIVPWDELWPSVDYTWVFGIAAGSLFVLFFALLNQLLPSKYTVFRVFPWLIFLTVVACSLFLLSPYTHYAAFILALGLSSVFEVLLIMYMGSLTLRGFVAPALAFGLSAGVTRLGIAAGNGLALIYERTPGLKAVMQTPTFLALITVLTALLILLVRQEYSIEEATKPPEKESDRAMSLCGIAQEFKLSNRETDILSLLARGYTAVAIAEKLVISKHTVNSHIQSIYTKLGIHKKSELIAYLNDWDQP